MERIKKEDGMKLGKLICLCIISLFMTTFIFSNITFATVIDKHGQEGVDSDVNVEKVEDEMKKPEGPPKPTKGMASRQMVEGDLIAIADGTADSNIMDRTLLLFLALAHEGPQSLSQYEEALLGESADKEGLRSAIAKFKERGGIQEVAMLSDIVSQENKQTDTATFNVGNTTSLDERASLERQVEDQKNLIRNLDGLGLALPGIVRTGPQVYKFALASPSEREYEAILFTEKFAMQNNSKDFVGVVNGLKENQVAVVIAEGATWENVWKQLQGIDDPNIQARIAKGELKVMSVAEGSTAYTAFEKLFAGQNYFNLSERIQTVDDLMKKEVLDALEGAV